MRRLLAPVLFLLCLSSPVLAQDAQDRATARRLAEQAQTAIEAKDFATAIDRLTRAVSLVPAPTLLLALGRAHREQGQLVEAEQRLLEAARFTIKPADPASWTDAAKQATGEAAAVTARIPSLSIVVRPAGAAVTVTLDGRPLSPASIGAPIAVNPGVRTVVVTGPGGSRTETKNVAERQQAKVDVDASALLSAAPPVASSAPLATSAPIASAASPPPPPPSSPPKRAQTHATAGYVALGAAGVFVGLGAFAGLTAKSKTNTIKESCVDGHCPAALQGDRDTAAKWADVSTVSFVLGAAFAGVGVFALTRTRSAEVAVSPQQVEVRGAF